MATEDLAVEEWQRIIGFKSTEDNETADVFVRYESNKKITGIAIVVTDPRAFTVVNIAGPVDLDSLADLSGRFGLPKLEAAPPGKQKTRVANGRLSSTSACSGPAKITARPASTSRRL